MRWLFAAVLAVHGLIHLMGFAKAFGYAAPPQLTMPISKELGVLWLAAAVLVTGSAVALTVWPRGWWTVGTIALVVSQVAIFSAWRDAWAGTIVNVLLLLAVAYGWLTYGPFSFRAQFSRDVAAGLALAPLAPPITEADLAPLPGPVQRYLRLVGVVGHPRVWNYRLRFSGRIRSAPDARWMPFEADQQSFADEPSRFFLMRARMFGLPVEAWHRMTLGHATMEVKVAGVVPVADARGEAADRSETVTVFNDMCLLAPATLVDSRIVWEAVDERTVRARFTAGAETISAMLLFGEDGLLANFVSDDRSRSSPDGKTFTRLRFSTPVRDYRAFGPFRLPTYGEARWLLPEGEFTYGEFNLLGAEYNVTR